MGLTILDTWLGRAAACLVAVALASGLSYWSGHRHGWAAATAHYKSVVQACMAANAQDTHTIDQLRQANQAYADAAKAQQAAADAAVAALQRQHDADAAKLADAQHRLDEAIHATPDAARWGAEHVPAAVADQLRD